MISGPLIAGIVWDPALPPPLIVGIGLVLGTAAVWIALKTGSRLTSGRRGLLLALRLVAVAMLCALLFQPMIEQAIPRRQPRHVVLAAVDTSESMAETDATGQATRLDAARRALAEAGLTDGGDLGEVRLFAFDENARPISAGALTALAATGGTTHVHQSIGTVLSHLRKGEQPLGLFVFSDGHDFEGVSAARTAQAARAKQSAIFPVPFGRVQSIPDASVHIASFQPYTFIHQRTQLQAAVRFVACENQQVRVELVREGKVVRDQRLAASPETEAAVSFEVSEETPGQYEYEIRVSALTGERELANNTAFTYLNVTDGKIRVLLIEGEPHWDTTFLLRTLTHNERMDVDSIVALGTGAPRLARSSADAPPLRLPVTAADFQNYPLIVLGRGMDRIFDPPVLDALGSAVTDGGVTVVLSRGQPGDHPLFEDLAPAKWLAGAVGPVRLTAGRGSGEVVPLEVLAAAPGGPEGLPPLPVVRTVDQLKPLAAVEAMAEDTGLHSKAPAFLHRRHGAGQVLAIGVEGLWKWSLHAKSEPGNNTYDRFWNQLVLNLIARSNAVPTDRTQLTVGSANVLLGEKVRFALRPATGRQIAAASPVAVFREQERVGEVTLSADASNGAWQATVLADRPGRYRAECVVDGEAVECRYAVYEERRESTDTAPDLGYLRKLADASGGRVLDPAGLTETIASLRHTVAAEAGAPPQVRRTSCWDRPGVFYFLCGVLGLEWFLRRRWGLM